MRPWAVCLPWQPIWILSPLQKLWLPHAVSVATYEELDRELTAAKERDALTFIEVKCGIGAREDLGRPTTTALENKQNFMEYLKNLG